MADLKPACSLGSVTSERRGFFFREARPLTALFCSSYDGEEEEDGSGGVMQSAW